MSRARYPNEVTYGDILRGAICLIGGVGIGHTLYGDGGATAGFFIGWMATVWWEGHRKRKREWRSQFEKDQRRNTRFDGK